MLERVVWSPHEPSIAEMLGAVCRSLSSLVVIFDSELAVDYANDAALSSLGSGSGDEPIRLSQLLSHETVRRLVQEGIPAAEASGAWRGSASLLAAIGDDEEAFLTLAVHRTSQGDVHRYSLVLDRRTPAAKTQDELPVESGPRETSARQAAAPLAAAEEIRLLRDECRKLRLQIVDTISEASESIAENAELRLKLGLMRDAALMEGVDHALALFCRELGPMVVENFARQALSEARTKHALLGAFDVRAEGETCGLVAVGSVGGDLPSRAFALRDFLSFVRSRCSTIVRPFGSTPWRELLGPRHAQLAQLGFEDDPF